MGVLKPEAFPQAADLDQRFPKEFGGEHDLLGKAILSAQRRAPKQLSELEVDNLFSIISQRMSAEHIQVFEDLESVVERKDYKSYCSASAGMFASALNMSSEQQANFFRYLMVSE